MKLTRKKILLLIVLLGVAALSYWIYDNFELKEIHYPSSLQGEAVRNNLLAAERFATAMGAQGSSGFGFRKLPEGAPGRAVLVMPTLRRTLTPKQREDMMQWINAGGHLIAVAHTLDGDKGKPDELLVAIGVKQHLTEEGKKFESVDTDTDDDLDDEQRIKRDREAKQQRERRALERSQIMRNMKDLMRQGKSCPPVDEGGSQAPLFPVPGKTLGVCFDTWYQLESRDRPLWSVTSKHGIHALTVARGKGKVTVLTDYDFMQNTDIDKSDHSVFLATLLGFTASSAAGASQPQQILFIPREDVTGIMSLTWKYGWPAALVLLAWLILGLWRAGARFGPLLPARAMVRRSLAEHVRASGEFLWRHGEDMHLLRAALARTRRQIDRVLPATAFPSAEQHLAALAKRSGIDAKHLERALDPNYAPPAEQFPTIIATLELLRKKL